MNPLIENEKDTRSPFEACEVELLARGLIAECSISGRWTEAAALIEKIAGGSPGPSVIELRELISARTANGGHDPRQSGLDSAAVLRRVRSLVEIGRIEEAGRMLDEALNDRNRIDPLSTRAEMVTLLAAISLRQELIGRGLDLFAQHLPADLVLISRDIGPAPAAMQAELLCAAGERHAACEIAARLKLLWPRDPIVSRLLGRVLEPESRPLPVAVCAAENNVGGSLYSTESARNRL